MRVIPLALRRFVAACVVSNIYGCATTDIRDWEQSLGVTATLLDTSPYPLMAAHNRPWAALRSDTSMPSTPVHVYIEGDGNAYITPTLPSHDPTPRDPVALQLMANDPSPALWLARPCQYVQASHCEPRVWTLDRYSDASLESLMNAMSKMLPADHPVILIGHSGGGTLAMLLAPQLPGVIAVITVAGNLDVARWTQHHRYSPLSGSRDPAQAPPLAPHIMQIHWVGGQDTNIPAQWAIESPQRPGRFVLLAPDTAHVCCWSQTWPTQLRIAEHLLQATRVEH